MLVYLNGKYLPQDEALVSVNDRGFLFGDGVYEVTRAVDGKLFGEEGHWQRLQNGLTSTRIGAERVDRGAIREIYEHLLKQNGHDSGHATVYLQVTRGSAPRNHAFPKPETKPTVYAFSSSFEIPHDLRTNGVKAIAHPDLRWSRCDIKTVNLLPNVMAKQKAKESGAWEALLIRNGVLMEGSASNLFGVIDGELRTYPLSNYILPGITRAVIVDLAREAGIPLRETPIFLEELGKLEELFFTGTTTDVQPVVQVDDQQIGDGTVGRVAQTLLDALMERMGATTSAAV